MPPKRAAPSASSNAASKRPRLAAEGSDSNSTNIATTNVNATVQLPPRPSKRWAKVSGSRNLDNDYKLAARNPPRYICLCTAPHKLGRGGEDEEEGDGWDDDDDDDDDEEEEEEDDGNTYEDMGEVEVNASARSRGKCDGGKTCICSKPADEHPDHTWKLSFAAKRKFFNQRAHCDLRDPDNFGMHTYNDHASYGIVESLENLVLDYAEAKDDLDEQWVVCETLGYFIPTDYNDPLYRIDDAGRANTLCILLGRLFMSMLARLEREGLLAPDSRIKNLSTIMGLWMLAAEEFRGQGCLEDNEEEEQLGPKKDKKKWNPSLFDSNVLAYAKKYHINFSGAHKAAEDIEENVDEIDLPIPGSNSGPNADPFGFYPALKKYKSDHGTPLIGGDKLDITTFTSAERKHAAFDGRDPLGKREMTALKQGLVLMM
ncbi:hypothetical protein TWF730_000442 [Orbilia blumenaviensis]|uniref:Uncharacterized protein n=1 Tax=Orbilia blumenaviensis TaxID=1796055 RepID=A0AAV9VLK0_9PEZI